MPRRPAALVISEAVSVDQLTGRVTAFNILDLVFAQNLPALLHRITALAAYELNGENETVYERAQLMSPAGEVVAGTNPMRIEFGHRGAGTVPASHTSIHTLWNSALRVQGDYSIVLSQSATTDGPWEEVARRRVVVAMAPHPLAPPAPAGQP